VLLYAFISNGETTRAMINPVAMKGEVKLGLVVGVIFLFRLIWVHNKRLGDGRWVGSSVQLPLSTIRRLTDWGIYLGVAATVVSGLLIAYLRPGAEIIPGNRFFLTRSPALNASIHAHVFVSNALEWLCAFHAVYATWYWLIKRSRWGPIAEGWLDRIASAADRVGVPHVLLRKFRQ
jgi:cytochrome b561